MKTQTGTVNKALARDCCCLLPQCHRTVRVTTFTFQFHTQFSPQRSTTTPPHHAGTTKWQLGVVSAGVICEAGYSIYRIKKTFSHISKTAKQTLKTLFIISSCSICRMTCCNNHLYHSAFRLPAAAHHPSQAISISTRWCAGAGKRTPSFNHFVRRFC